MMTIRLAEGQVTRAVPLTVNERDLLAARVQSLRISPTPGRIGAYDLLPESQVGIARVGALTLEIHPKVPISSMMFMLAYAIEPRHWSDYAASVYGTSDLFESVAFAFG